MAQDMRSTVQSFDLPEVQCRKNIHRFTLPITRLECQVSELVNSDTRPHPTTDACAQSSNRSISSGDTDRGVVVGRGHVSPLSSSDTWHSKRVMDIADL